MAGSGTNNYNTMKTENLPAYLLKHIRIRHLHQIVVHSGNLVQLGVLSPQQPVRKYAWLRYVAQNQN